MAVLNIQMGINDFSAKDAVNNLNPLELEKIFKFFGEEKEAARIARNIIKTRESKRITLVTELVDIIEKSKKKN